MPTATTIPRVAEACLRRQALRRRFGFSSTGTPACALGFSLLRRTSIDLEGAPPLVCKGGLFRRYDKGSRLLVLAFTQPVIPNAVREVSSPSSISSSREMPNTEGLP